MLPAIDTPGVWFERLRRHPWARPATHVASLSVASICVGLISLVSSILLVRWVPPEDMRFWQVGNVVLSYVAFLHLGVYSGVNRDLPALLGAGLKEEMTRLSSAALGWTRALEFGTLAATIALAFLFGARVGANAAWTCLAVGLVAMMTWRNQYLSAVYKGLAEFTRFTASTVLTAVIGLALVVPIAFFGYEAFLVRAVLMALCAVVFLQWRIPLSVPAVWDFRRVRDLVIVGAPIFAVGQLAAVFTSMDRIALAPHGIALGLFTVAIQAQTASRMLPTTVVMVAYQRMAERWGGGARPFALWSLAAKAALASAVLGAAAAAIGWVVVPWLLPKIAPAYVEATSAAQWACLLGLAEAFATFGPVFNVLKRQVWYLVPWGVSLASFWTLWTLAPHATDPGHAAALAARSMVFATVIGGATSAAVAFAVCRRMPPPARMVPVC